MYDSFLAIQKTFIFDPKMIPLKGLTICGW